MGRPLVSSLGPVFGSLWLMACSSPATMMGTDGPSPDLAGTGPGGIHYTTGTVDDTASGVNVALVMDAKDTPQIFYLSKGTPVTCNLGVSPSTYHPAQLNHAVPAGAGYTTLVVNGTALVEANGLSAALDPKAGKPVVAFQGGKPGVSYCGGSDAMLGHFDGAAWSLTTVATASTAQSGMVDRPGATAGPVDKSGDVVGTGRRWPSPPPASPTWPGRTSTSAAWATTTCPRPTSSSPTTRAPASWSGTRSTTWAPGSTTPWR